MSIRSFSSRSSRSIRSLFSSSRRSRRRPHRRFIVLLTLAFVLSGSQPAIPGMLVPTDIDTPAVAAAQPAPPGVLRVMTWNVAHGRAESFHQALLLRAELETNLDRIAGVLRRENPDIVALQEADGPSMWSGNFDHVRSLAGATHLDHAFRGDHNPFALRGLELSSGTALLSRTPLAAAESRAFSASWRDTKGFVMAAVELPAVQGAPPVMIDVVSVHLDFLSPAERRLQIDELVAELAGRDRPLVVMGDLNSSDDAIELLGERLGLAAYRPAAGPATFPAGQPLRRLDWILASPELEFIAYRTLEDRLSDHLGVVAELRLAEPLHAAAAS